MKATYFTRFIANYCLICILLICSTQAQALGKDKFCYEVLEYVYKDENRNSSQDVTLRDKSFDALLELTNGTQQV